MGSWKDFVFTLKCLYVQNWKLLVTCVGNFWWWAMFLVWR